MSRLTIATNTFLDAISNSLDIKRSTLSITAELRKHGSPTISPRSSQYGETPVDINKHPPLASYDTLGSNHIQYDVFAGTIRLFSFQHHAFPGNCRICINRWVQTFGNDWTENLQMKALDFRKEIARIYGYRTLVVSSGRSFSGAESYISFTPIYETDIHRILVLPLFDDEVILPTAL